jgi:hypothetical protein
MAFRLRGRKPRVCRSVTICFPNSLRPQAETKAENNPLTRRLLSSNIGELFRRKLASGGYPGFVTRSLPRKTEGSGAETLITPLGDFFALRRAPIGAGS